MDEDLLEQARRAAEASKLRIDELQRAEDEAARLELRAESARLRDSARALRAERRGYADLIAELRATVAQLEDAMLTRSVIEQAKGVVMASRHCDAEEAFDVLRRISQNQNRKLHDIAAEVVGRVASPPALRPEVAARVGDSRPG